MNPNMLKQWLDFYDQQNLGGPASMASWHSGMDAANAAGARVNFATRMAQQNQMPGQGEGSSFFNSASGQPNGGSYQSAAYVPPQQFAPGPQPQMTAPDDPMRGRVNNYLSHLLGGR